MEVDAGSEVGAGSVVGADVTGIAMVKMWMIYSENRNGLGGVC